MRIGLLAAGCVAAAAMASAASAQDADDWEFQQDTAQNITVAAVRYDGGSMIVVQCKAGALTAVMAGVPQSTGALKLEATRADGRHDLQEWAPAGAPGAFRSDAAARDVRFMRGGGAFAVRTSAGVTPPFAATFDLPTQSANLDRVLTACGWALTDDRDALTRADSGVRLSDSDDAPTRPRRGSSSRDIAGRGRHREAPAAPATPTPPPAEQQISCIIRDKHLTECRQDHPPVAGAPANPRGLGFLEGHEVFPPEGSDQEGKVILLFISQILIQVARG